jgi:HlyD family secretion protein
LQYVAHVQKLRLLDTGHPYSEITPLLAVIRHFLIAATIASLLSACSDGPGAVPEAMQGLRVTTLRVQSQLNTSTIELYGQLVAENPTLIKPLIDGARIEAVLVEEGQSVVAGQALVKLDTRSLVSEQQQQRQARIRLQAQALASTAQLQQSESKVLQSLDELKRYREVADSGAVSKLDLIAREQTYAQARAERDGAMRNVNAAQAELRQAEALETLANERFKDGVIRAPFAGIISARRAEVGAITSTADDPLFVLASNEDREFEAYADTAILQQLKRGDKADIRLSGMNTALSGRIRSLDQSVSNQNQRARIRISMTETSNAPLGNTGQVRISLQSKTGITVPASALQFDPRPWVFIVDKNLRLSQRYISLAPNSLEVIAGLKEGEVIVRSAGALLTAGQNVQPVSTTDKVKSK